MSHSIAIKTAQIQSHKFFLSHLTYLYRLIATNWKRYITKGLSLKQWR